MKRYVVAPDHSEDGHGWKGVGTTTTKETTMTNDTNDTTASLSTLRRILLANEKVQRELQLVETLSATLPQAARNALSPSRNTISTAKQAVVQAQYRYDLARKRAQEGE